MAYLGRELDFGFLHEEEIAIVHKFHHVEKHSSFDSQIRNNERAVRLDKRWGLQINEMEISIVMPFYRVN